MKQSKRDQVYDITRAICILWITTFWHVRDNVEITITSRWAIDAGALTTLVVLGAFAFISGHFLRKNQFNKAGDVFKFYGKRLKRFGIPFFIASTLLHIASLAAGTPWYSSHTNFFLSLFGLSVFFPPLPPTLWFLSMMMFFYLITPLLMYGATSRQRLLISLTVIIVFIVLLFKGIVEDRVVVMLIMYVLGLHLTNKVPEAVKRNAWLGLCISCLLILFAAYAMPPRAWYTILYLELTGLVFLISLSTLLSRSRVISLIGNKISYASMFMYLFHRHFLLTGLLLFNIRHLGNAHEMVMPAWFAYCIVIPLMIVVCYYSQKLYDRILESTPNR